ncbi:MAG TPA: hypothetical protein VF412_01760 [Bdellovibrio sp.]|uniref:hypothetical protein n=1 Tax=Bdellovibrio sp. TaxID=28201 RepID=UPI002F1DB54E
MKAAITLITFLITILIQVEARADRSADEIIADVNHLTVQMQQVRSMEEQAQLQKQLQALTKEFAELIPEKKSN